uniref:Uncharacterized protein n=1 Tax=Vespula pensylvanica TaxID=30213 RepID=A0A834PD07_VESPE|nr:hypothetical protein H0235_003999 [Vespula pensylvanica]
MWDGDGMLRYFNSPETFEIRRKKHFGKTLKYAAIRPVVLALHNLNIISKYRKYYRPRSHHVEVAASGDPRANGDSTLKFANQTESFTVGLLIASENTTPVPADTGDSVLSILPVFRADILRFAKKKKRGREREEQKKKMRREESQNVCTRGKDGAEKKRKKRISVSCNGNMHVLKFGAGGPRLRVTSTQQNLSSTLTVTGSVFLCTPTSEHHWSLRMSFLLIFWTSGHWLHLCDVNINESLIDFNKYRFSFTLYSDE